VWARLRGDGQPVALARLEVGHCLGGGEVNDVHRTARLPRQPDELADGHVLPGGRARGKVGRVPPRVAALVGHRRLGGSLDLGVD
jgi:hypothetical protein